MYTVTKSGRQTHSWREVKLKVTLFQEYLSPTTGCIIIMVVMQSTSTYVYTRTCILYTKLYIWYTCVSNLGLRIVVFRLIWWLFSTDLKVTLFTDTQWKALKYKPSAQVMQIAYIQNTSWEVKTQTYIAREELTIYSWYSYS